MYQMDSRKLFTSMQGIVAALMMGTALIVPASAHEIGRDEFCTKFPQNSRCEGYQPQPWQVNPSLSEGEAVATHEQDRFQGQVLISASQDQVWSVLTDYNRFAEFLPGVIENQATLVEQKENGRSLIMNSTSVTQVFLAQIESSIRLELQEQAKSQIGFSLLSGDNLSRLDGKWLLETIAPPDSPKFQDRDSVTLVTYQANASSDAGFQGVFANIFTNQIEKNLAAIQQETLRRFANPA